MDSKFVLVLALVFVLLGVLGIAIKVERVEASGTIYIRANGLIEGTDKIVSSDNVTYTFIDNINDSIVVERDNIVVDGAGYTVQGAGSGTGIDLSGRSNVTIKNTNIKNFYFGISLSGSSNNSIFGNNIKNNSDSGIWLRYSNYNSITGNNITNNEWAGIWLADSSECSVCENTIYDNDLGIYIYYSSHSILRNNNMTANNRNLGVYEGWGPQLNYLVHDIDISNTVNGKPVYYLINKSDLIVNPVTYPEIGYLAVVNFTNIIAENLVLTNNLEGVLFAYGESLILKNITATENDNGIDVVEVSNCSISDCNATGNYHGICLTFCSNSFVSRNNVIRNDVGVRLTGGYNCSISGNNANSNELYGIELTNSYICSVLENNMKFNVRYGIVLRETHNCSFFGNNIIGNILGGVYNSAAINNTFYHNNFIHNGPPYSKQIETDYYSKNAWDDGYPSGGNYWSDFNGSDSFFGPFQNLTGSDGIGDTPYIIDENNTDHYPLMGTFSNFKATSELHVQTICNSSISDFQFNGTAISFYVSGENSTTGLCRICIPTALMNGTYRVFVNGTEVSCNLLPCSNSTHSYLYFNYTHSTQEVIIIPEFPSFLILPLFMIITPLAVIVYKRKRIT